MSNQRCSGPVRILFIGSQWHGSDSTGLARGLRRLGHMVATVDEDAFFPAGCGVLVRGARRLLRPIFVREFNAAVLRVARSILPELVVVAKGTNLLPDTIVALKAKGAYVTMFYPDTSFVCEGPLIPQCLPFYDWIFTSKSFGVSDLKDKFGIERCELLHHGFDSDVHRPFALRPREQEPLSNDVSFIGTWSKKKESILARLAAEIPNVDFRIWGNYWYRSESEVLNGIVQGTEVMGDAYALAVQCSKVNIALLTSGRPGAPSGDKVTARTFQIPACGGFMLHERTEEVGQFFREGEEVACFGDPTELVAKVRYYLSHEEEREAIRMAGYHRCISENGHELRAQRIIEHFHEYMHLNRKCARDRCANLRVSENSEPE